MPETPEQIHSKSVESVAFVPITSAMGHQAQVLIDDCLRQTVTKACSNFESDVAPLAGTHEVAPLGVDAGQIEQDSHFCAFIPQLPECLFRGTVVDDSGGRVSQLCGDPSEREFAPRAKVGVRFLNQAFSFRE
ncbi:MAG TPA: hypothetical protein VN697_09635 [Tepidiformaceae bacterium]|nr:hypothetical protein [Tepidiformaceae bacterium]